MYRVTQKLAQYFVRLYQILTCSKLFKCQNREKICNNTITKNPITPQGC